MGAGSDGILVLDPAGDGRTRVTILNPDGSEAEFSGNGTRIAAGYLMRRDGVDELTMATLKGEIRARRIGEEIEIDAGRAALDGPDHRPGDGAPPAERYTFVSVGNPHCVVEVDDPDVLDLRAVGEPIERHPWFPNRTNVEFYRPLEEHEIRMRVWERGAGETLSSGSGSTAAAVAAVVNGRARARRHRAPGRRLAAYRRRRRPRHPADRTGRAGPRRPLPRRLHDHPGEPLVREAKRVAQLPPYLFAELERKIADRRKAGADVISLGIGDPDLPTLDVVVQEAERQVARSDTHQYPSNRGRAAFREAVAAFYKRRFGVDLDPETEVLPLLGGKEGVAHICWSMLDPGDVCLAADPGYPVYTSGATLAGAESVLMPLRAENAVPARPGGDRRRRRGGRANLLFCNYPNNPTGAVIDDDFFERLARFGLEHEIPIVHDNAYSEITFDGYVAGSYLQAPGAKEAGVEMFSLSKSFNMTGWRVGAAVGNAEMLERALEAEDEHRLGDVRGRSRWRRCGRSATAARSSARCVRSTAAGATW